MKYSFHVQLSVVAVLLCLFYIINPADSQCENCNTTTHCCYKGFYHRIEYTCAEYRKLGDDCKPFHKADADGLYSYLCPCAAGLTCFIDREKSRTSCQPETP